ncbi:MAG: PilN domain-containing protein [Verrucomicrobiae bacterium]|nr:PilN domain-containing protein [Verrucomicrobiae bacterium]
MSRLKIALPDENRGWTLRTGRAGSVPEGRELAAVAGNGADVLVGVPASLCTTFALKVPTTEAMLFPSLVQSQIERRGLAHRGDGAATPQQFFVIEQAGNETWLSVDVLSEDFPEELSLPKAAGYSPSGRLLRLPEDRLLLWREHKRLVLAANRHGHLTHLQVLSAEPELNVATAQEINLTTLSLQAEGLLNDTPELTVVGQLATDKSEGRVAFQKALLVPAEFRSESPEAVPAPSVNDSFLPTAVMDARRRRAALRRRSLAGAMAAILYLAIGSWLWLYAQKTEAKIADLTGQVEETRPGVTEIQETEARWRELEPGFDLHYFPLVQLNEVTRVMPGSGVLVRQFETKGRNITIDGSARDVQMAFRLKEDLEKNPFFKAYSWNMPQPKVERNNMATFRIQGQPKHEGADN